MRGRRRTSGGGGRAWQALVALGAVLALLAFVALRGGLLSPEAVGRAPDGTGIVAAEPLGVDAFNAALDAAAVNGAPWTRDPTWIAVSFVGPSRSPRFSLQRADYPPDLPETSTVTVVQEDDPPSLTEAVWTELLLERHQDGSWRLVEARRAYRCRGLLLPRFTAQECSAAS